MLLKKYNTLYKIISKTTNMERMLLVVVLCGFLGMVQGMEKPQGLNTPLLRKSKPMLR
jgi:hypothetical protein